MLCPVRPLLLSGPGVRGTVVFNIRETANEVTAFVTDHPPQAQGRAVSAGAPTVDSGGVSVPTSTCQWTPQQQLAHFVMCGTAGR